MTTPEQDATAGLRGIDADAMAAAGLLIAGKTATLTWPHSGSMDHMQTLALTGALRLTYVETLSDGNTALEYTYDIPLKRMRRHHGQDRVSFLCPLCKSEVKRLYYVRPGGGLFLCETCQDMNEEENRERGRPKVKRPYVRKTPMKLTPRRSDTEAFCCRCRDRREMKHVEIIIMANGRSAMRGTCALCGTKAARFVAKAPGQSLS